MSRNTMFDITFKIDEKKYSGWVDPSDKMTNEGTPASFYVVLNNASFGYVSFEDCKWNVNNEQPRWLVRQIGKQIEKHYEF